MRIVPGLPALITGASSGIGRGVALALAARGARIGLLARRAELLEELGGQVKAAGGEAQVLPADVGDAAAVESAVATVVDRFGGLRLVVANAGFGRYAPVEEQPLGQAEALIRANYLGTVYTVRAALPALLEGAPSHIVSVASSAGLIPHPTASAYSASKAAVIQYLAALRMEVIDRGVGVSWVCPGAVDTPYLADAGIDPERDLPLLARLFVRTLDADDVVRAVLSAVEHNRREVTLPPMMRFFAWTRRVTPQFADWLIRRFP